jgi:hypothetical protein
VGEELVIMDGDEDEDEDGDNDLLGTMKISGEK